VLDARIEARVRQMWADGFVAEVEGLLAAGLADGRTAARALGYSQVLDYLGGTLTQAQAQQATIEATRKFARRQQRWFRRDERITWIAYDAPDAVERVLSLVEAGTAT
jgi:tRNA dimethylallyltransferase